MKCCKLNVFEMLTRNVFRSSRNSSPRRVVPAKQQSRSLVQQAVQSVHQVQSSPIAASVLHSRWSAVVPLQASPDKAAPPCSSPDFLCVDRRGAQ